jgi:hypothetical protein
VLPFDEHSNSLSVADGFAVTVEGLGSKNDEKYELASAGSFSVSIPIRENLEADVSLFFTLGGVSISDGAPVVISVSPSLLRFDSDAIGGIVFATILGACLIYSIYRYSQGETGDATVFTKQKELIQNFTGIANSVFDPVTDFFNWYLVMSLCQSFMSTLYIALVVMSVFGAVHAIAVSVKQIRAFDEDIAVLTFGDADLEREYKELTATYGTSAVVAIQASMFGTGVTRVALLSTR